MDRERRSGVGHHTKVGGVQRLASAAQLLHVGEYRRPAVSIYPSAAASAHPYSAASAEAARALADRRRFRRRALRDVPAGSSPASICTFSSISGPGASQRDHDGAPTGQEVSERPHPRPRGGDRGLRSPASMLSPACIPGYTTAGRRGGAERRRRLGQSPTRFQSLASSRAPHRRAPCWPSGIAFGGAPRRWSETIVSAAVAPIAVRRNAPGRCSRAARAGDGVEWGAVDHFSDVDMVHMPAEMSMETARRTDADLLAALLVGTADTVVALVEDGELSRAAG
eukprot:jgi/Tetstr1/433444/TSEL_022718.t1